MQRFAQPCSSARTVRVCLPKAQHWNAALHRLSGRVPSHFNNANWKVLQWPRVH